MTYSEEGSSEQQNEVTFSNRSSLALKHDGPLLAPTDKRRVSTSADRVTDARSLTQGADSVTQAYLRRFASCLSKALRVEAEVKAEAKAEAGGARGEFVVDDKFGVADSGDSVLVMEGSG